MVRGTLRSYVREMGRRQGSGKNTRRMLHKIEASRPTFGRVTFEIETESPEKAFGKWKQIVPNPRGWNRIVNGSVTSKPNRFGGFAPSRTPELQNTSVTEFGYVFNETDIHPPQV